MTGEMIVVLLVLAIIPAMIAHSKGRDFVVWYLYGVVLLIIAIPHSLLISKSEEKKKEEQKEQGYIECPFCKEPVKKGAVVCPHCRRDLPVQEEPEPVNNAAIINKKFIEENKLSAIPEQPKAKENKLAQNLIIGIVALAVLGGVIYFAAVNTPPMQSPDAKANHQPIRLSQKKETDNGLATLAKYNQIQNGMSYDEAAAIMKSPGKLQMSNGGAGHSTKIYIWNGAGGANMNIEFVDGKVFAKGQAGLD